MKLRMFLHYLTMYLSLLTSILLSYAAFYFLKYNQPIIKNFYLLAVLIFLPILFIFWASIKELRRAASEPDGRPRERLMSIRIAFFVFCLLAAGILVYTFLQAALLDYFQPFSLYDDVIYVSLVGFVLLIIRILIDAVRYLINILGSRHTIYFNIAILVFLVVIAGWGMLQADFEYTNISGEPIQLFAGGSGDYEIYRIPSLITLPMGSVLQDGSELDQDLVIAFAEARRNGSLDNGDIDLIMRRSLDGGTNWEDEVVVRQWEDGVGKIGNPTPVYNSGTGELILFHIAGSGTKTIWVMRSSDGGESFSEIVEFGAGTVGPGHGIQISSGENVGRLVIPVHIGGSSASLVSDDGGEIWTVGESAGIGNESEIAETSEGLAMVVRTNHPVAKPHAPLFTLFSVSGDGGSTWSLPVENQEVPTPICMASLIESSEGRIYYSTPDDHFSRAMMTIYELTDLTNGYDSKNLIFAGPSGYSDMAPLSDGSMLLLFENGAVEYDERLTLVHFVP